jgi:hypothetical protein
LKIKLLDKPNYYGIYYLLGNATIMNNNEIFKSMNSEEICEHFSRNTLTVPEAYWALSSKGMCNILSDTNLKTFYSCARKFLPTEFLEFPLNEIIENNYLETFDYVISDLDAIKNYCTIGLSLIYAVRSPNNYYFLSELLEANDILNFSAHDINSAYFEAIIQNAPGSVIRLLKRNGATLDIVCTKCIAPNSCNEYQLRLLINHMTEENILSCIEKVITNCISDPSCIKILCGTNRKRIWNAYTFALDYYIGPKFVFGNTEANKIIRSIVEHWKSLDKLSNSNICKGIFDITDAMLDTMISSWEF